MHDKTRREIIAQQTVVWGCNREVPAQQVKPFVRSEVFADREILRRPVARRQRCCPASVVHHVSRVAGKQEDVAGLQQQRLSARGVVQDRRAGKHRMIGDLVGHTRSLLDTPGHAVAAAQVEPPAHRHHLEQPAEPIHGQSP
ncbi:hypothetical protein ABIF31_008579 [Bradyrhizobium elkanii]